METLATRIKREGALKPMDAVGWAIRLAKNLERIHARKIVHGRITPYCLMIELADCASVGMLVDAERLPDPVSYHSPERASGEEEKPSDDTWGVAATLYEALTGKPLFEDDDDEATRAKILAPSDGHRVVLDAGGTALQGILNRALARDWMERTNNITALRRELEALRPATRFGALMPLLEDTRKAASASQRPPPGMFDDDDGPTLVASMRDISKVAALKDKPAEAEAAASPAPTSNAPPKLPAAPSSPAPANPSPSTPSPPAAVNRPKREGGADGQFDFAGLRSRLLGAPEPQPTKREDDQAREPPPADQPEPAPTPIALVRKPEAAPAFAAAPPPPARPLPPPVPKAQPAAVVPRPPVPAAPPTPPPPRVEEAAPRKKRGSRTGLVIFVVLLLAGAGAAYQFKEPLLKKVNELRANVLGETAAPPAATTAQAPTGAATPAPPATGAAPGTVSAEASAAPPASASTAPSAATAPAKPGDVNACIRPLFPPDTFTGDAMPDFSFLCNETDPRKGIGSMKTRIVLGNGGHVSEGMKEWALSGWYQLATFSVVRARCCPSPPPLSLPDNPGRCARVDERLNELGAATVAAKDMKDAKLKEAVDNFTTCIHCMVRIGTTGAFTRHDNPQGGEDTAFMKMLARVVVSNQ